MKLKLNKLSKWNTYVVAALLLFAFVIGSTRATAQISSATVNVNGAIAAPTGATSSTGSFATCAGNTLTLTPTGGNTGSDGLYKWYTGSCGGTLVGTGATLDYTVTADVTIYVRVESPVCGNSACYAINLTVNPVPTVTTTLSNIVVCNGVSQSAIALAGTPSGVTFDISGGADVGIADAAAASSIAAFTTTNTSNDAITRTITVTPKANGCNGTPATFDVTVFPAVTITATSDIAACNGQSVAVPVFTNSITTTGPLGTSAYAWTNTLTSIGLGASGSSNIASFAGTNTGTTAAVGTLTVTPTYTIGGKTCSGSSDAFTITINPTPNGTISIDPTICSGGSSPLLFHATNGAAYGPWTLGIAEGSATATPTSYPNVSDGASILSASPMATTTYYLMSITDANGCSNP